jgi:8-oxo-dGTP diphosphatase
MPVSDQGPLLGRYTLIPRTLIFLNHQEQILLLKGAPTKRLWANLYNGLGGHIERGEDILSAAKRELKEESGITPSTLWLCGVITIDTGQDVGICIYVFRGECPMDAVFISGEGIPEWVHFSEIDSLPLVEDLRTILPLVMSMNPGDPPFAAIYKYKADGELVINIG